MDPISVLFTDVDVDKARGIQRDLDIGVYRQIRGPINEIARHRVIVGKGGKVLKDNTGFCTKPDGTFDPPIAEASDG